MKVGKTIFLLLILISAYENYFSESNLIVDPLLEKPWIPDAREEEIRGYHNFLSLSPEVSKASLHQDVFGRNYRLYPSMKIRYAIDNDYHREFPILGDGDLAFREMEALVLARREKDAIFLGKGIGLCQRIHAKIEKDFVPKWANGASLLTSQLINKLSDKSEEVSLVSEPYGCYDGDNVNIGNLVLESETFRYQVSIPSSLRYEGLFRKEAGRIHHEKDFVARLVRFVEFITPVRAEGMGEMEEALILGEAGLTKKIPKKILFSIGTTFDYNARTRTTENYFKYWDKERGLTPKFIVEKTFFRVEEKGDYVSQWTTIDETGNSIKQFMKEYYFYKSPLGIFLSLSYPESEKEKAESYWQRIKSDFKVK